MNRHTYDDGRQWAETHFTADFTSERAGHFAAIVEAQVQTNEAQRGFAERMREYERTGK
jgi:hypothetical protein